MSNVNKPNDIIFYLYALNICIEPIYELPIYKFLSFLIILLYLYISINNTLIPCFTLTILKHKPTLSK